MKERFSPEPRQPRQFTLAGLMSFVVGWSAYCSVIAATWSWVGSNYWLDEDDRRPNRWLMGVTVAGCWVLLWFLYRRWGLRHALKVHCAGPMIFTLLSALLGVVGALGALSNGGAMDAVIVVCLAPLLGALYGCFISILIGFPIAVIMLFFVAPASGRSARENPRVTAPAARAAWEPAAPGPTARSEAADRPSSRDATC